MVLHSCGSSRTNMPGKLSLSECFLNLCGSVHMVTCGLASGRTSLNQTQPSKILLYFLVKEKRLTRWTFRGHVTWVYLIWICHSVTNPYFLQLCKSINGNRKKLHICSSGWYRNHEGRQYHNLTSGSIPRQVGPWGWTFRFEVIWLKNYNISVRITSNTQYNTGLFVLDLNRAPWGCGQSPFLPLPFWIEPNLLLY